MTDFFVPPVRTDATETDPYDTLEPGLVIRPETDAEIAARQATEPPPPAPDPDPESRQLSLLHRLVEKAGSVARAAVGAAVDAAERVLPKPQAYGIECRNGYIIQFTGQEDGKTLAARRQHLLDNRSASSVESVADGKVYQLMKEYCDGLPDDTPVKARDLFLSVADALEKQTLFDRLAGMLGSRRAFVAVMGSLPPPPRPPDNCLIVRWEQMIIVGHGHRFREPHFIIATPWISPAELESSWSVC